jgi:hypothetical protein
LVEQLIHLYLLGFILFMNRKIIKIYFFTDGNIRIVLLFVDSTLAITSWHTITTSYYSTPYSLLLYFWFTKWNGSTTSFIQPTFLSGVLIYDEQGSFINCVASNYYEWYSLGEIALKTEKTPYYYLNRIILQCHFNYPKTILGNIIAKHSRYISK